MTKTHYKNYVFVATASARATLEFCEANGLSAMDVVDVQTCRNIYGYGSIREIWVLTEIGGDTAELIGLCVEKYKCAVKYAHSSEKVVFSHG